MTYSEKTLPRITERDYSHDLISCGFVNISDEIKLFTKPFNPMIILSPHNQEVLYWTQTYSVLSENQPSIIRSTRSTTQFYPDTEGLYRSKGWFMICQYETDPDMLLEEKNSFIIDLEHELRTTAMLIETSTQVIAKTCQTTSKALKILLKASRRQKVVTLISSEFIRLLSSPPPIEPISLIDLVEFIQNKVYMKFFCNKSFRELVAKINPIIWGNFHFLINLLGILVEWNNGCPLSVKIESNDPLSLHVSFIFHSLLSEFQCVDLILRFFRHFSAYFNYLTQTREMSLDLFIPLVLRI